MPPFQLALNNYFSLKYFYWPSNCFVDTNQRGTGWEEDGILS